MLARAPRIRPGPAWVVVSVAVAMLSLPFGHALAFDASAWVVWGREVWHLGLDTSSGPSWKPFPVLFTAPLSLLGDATGAAWLVVARAGALLAVVGAARLAARTAGPWGAVLAAAAVVLSPWWLFNGALGNADPLLGGFVVWALLAAGEDRPRAAFALLAAGALVRPEVWPFLAVVGLVLARRGRVGLVPVVAVGAGVLALWVLPDLLSSGLSSTKGATGAASAGSASLTDVPFLTVWKDLVDQAPWVTLAAGLLGVAAVARRTGPPRAIGWTATLSPRGPAAWLLLAAAYTLLVAAMAQAGFAGNPRYLVPALTLVAAAAGALVALAAGVPRARPVVVVVVAAALLAVTAGGLRDQVRDLDQRASSRRALVDAVDAAGGRARLRRCGPVRTAPVVRSVVAEVLHESIPDAGDPLAPGQAAVRPAPDGGWAVVGGGCRDVATP